MRQEGTAFLSESRMQIPIWGGRVVYAKEQPNFKCVCVRKMDP